MNPGPLMAILFFCVLPLLTIGLSFWAGVRYARYGWSGILPKRKVVIPDGPKILPTR